MSSLFLFKVTLYFFCISGRFSPPSSTPSLFIIDLLQPLPPFAFPSSSFLLPAASFSLYSFYSAARFSLYSECNAAIATAAAAFIFRSSSSKSGQWAFVSKPGRSCPWFPSPLACTVGRQQPPGYPGWGLLPLTLEPIAEPLPWCVRACEELARTAVETVWALLCVSAGRRVKGCVS